MSIITCTAKTRNDLTVARIVIEVLAQSWGYKCSVTYNDGKSFDIMVPDGAEANAIEKFKRQAPDLDIYKASKKVMANSQKESKAKKESADAESIAEDYADDYEAGNITLDEIWSEVIGNYHDDNLAEDVIEALGGW